MKSIITTLGKQKKSEKKPTIQSSENRALSSSSLDITRTAPPKVGAELYAGKRDVKADNTNNRSESLVKLLEAANNHLKTIKGFPSSNLSIEKVEPYTFQKGTFYLPSGLQKLEELDSYHTLLALSISKGDINLAFTEGDMVTPATDADDFMRGFLVESNNERFLQKSRMTKNQYTLGTMSFRYELHSRVANKASIKYFYFHDLEEAVKISLERINRNIFPENKSAADDTLKVIRTGVKTISSSIENDEVFLSIKRTPEDIWGTFRIKTKTVIKGKTLIKNLKPKKPWEYLSIPKDIKDWLHTFTYLPNQDKTVLYGQWTTETESENLNSLYKEFSALFDKFVTISQKGRKLNNDYVREASRYATPGRPLEIQEIWERSKNEGSNIVYNILSLDRIQRWAQDASLCLISSRNEATLSLREIYGLDNE